MTNISEDFVNTKYVNNLFVFIILKLLNRHFVFCVITTDNVETKKSRLKKKIRM